MIYFRNYANTFDECIFGAPVQRRKHRFYRLDYAYVEIAL